MKASKQRKIARAIVSNKALRNSEAGRLTSAQAKVMQNSYKYHQKSLNKLMKALREKGL